MTIFLNVGTNSGGAASSTFTIQATADWFAGQNGELVNYELTNPSSPAVVQVINLVMGDNLIDATVCPAIATAAGVVIMPPPGSGTTVALKKAIADTGFPLAFTGAPTVLSLANPPVTSFYLNANSTLTGLRLCWF